MRFVKSERREERMEPTVSIIMAAYNSEKFIGDAIESVLAQTYQKFELLIIEDASKDGTLTKIRSYQDDRIRVLLNEHNSGTLYCMQRGVAEARGKYIAVLDSDDIAEPDRIRMQVKVLDAKPEVLLCATKIRNLVNGRLEKVEYIPINNARQLKFSMLFGNMIAHSSIMFRKEELQKKKVQYETYSYCHDYHFTMSVGQVGPIYMINKELVQYRVHRDQKTNVLSKNSILREVNSAREEFLRQVRGLSSKEVELLCNAIWGNLTSLYEFIQLKKILFHYASLCRLHLKKDKELILYEFYSMFCMQKRGYQWYIYYMIEFYLRCGSRGTNKWNKIW